MRYFLMNYTSPSGHDYEVEKMARKLSRTIAENYDEVVRIAGELLEKSKLVNPDSELTILKAKAGTFYININDDVMIDMLFYEMKEDTIEERYTISVGVWNEFMAENFFACKRLLDKLRKFEGIVLKKDELDEVVDMLFDMVEDEDNHNREDDLELEKREYQDGYGLTLGGCIVAVIIITKLNPDMNIKTLINDIFV